MILVRILRTAFSGAGFLALLWFAGLVAFANHVRALDPAVVDDASERADAIVVLTGGSERVRTGIELLQQNMGKKLLISGVYPGLTLDKVLGPLDIDPALRACCITLGHAADSTEGNAEETGEWLAIQNFSSIRLVTANYHMPRSLLLFHNELPNVRIIPHPIAPENVKLDHWWAHTGTASLLVTEYNKYLFARLGLLLGNL